MLLASTTFGMQPREAVSDWRLAVRGAGGPNRQPLIANRFSARGLLNLARPDAPRANVDAPDRAFHDGADALQIRHPPAGAHVVRVAHLVSENRRLAADFTHFCHRFTPQIMRMGRDCALLVTGREVPSKVAF